MSGQTSLIAVAAIGLAAVVLICFLMAVVRAGRPLSQNTVRLLLIVITVAYAALIIWAGRWTRLSLPLGVAVVGAYALAEDARAAFPRWAFWVLGAVLSAAALALQCLGEELDLWLGLFLGVFGLLLAAYAGHVARRLIRNSRQSSTPTETGTPA